MKSDHEYIEADAEPASEHELTQYAHDRLGFYDIRNTLSDCASSQLGRNAAEELLPMNDPNEIREALDETQQMREIMKSSSIPLAGMADLSNILVRAEKQSVLSAEDLWKVSECIDAARKLKKFFTSKDEETPSLAQIVEPLEPSEKLAQQIQDCINENAEVKDNASSDLATIRRGIRSTADNLRNKLEKMAKRLARDGVLQEPIVTQRNSRYVLPVKQEYRQQVKGIVHGQSSSGATIFVEPQIAVELNNKLHELLSEEEREVQRILAELSFGVNRNCEELRSEQRILSYIDLTYAKASLAQRQEAIRPNINEQRYIYLKEARHPMLGSEVVPIDVQLGKEFDTLVVTGPNTGGKTVTLKTVGLMVLMSQAGMHIPCDVSSDVGVFSRVYCDIGDEQSIDQNLSTFSSHMRNVIPILQLADDHCLVLLDELGAGTDPMEGAPLAMAILHKLHEENTRTMATTHYSRLKTFAYQVDGIENASMEFDVETLSPTYNLIMGLPGRSNALEIAERLGMPTGLVERARSYLSEEEGDVEDLIASMEEDRRAWDQYRRKAKTEAKDAKILRERLAKKEKELREKQQKVLVETRREAEKIVKHSRQECKELLREIHKMASELRNRRKRGADQLSDPQDEDDTSKDIVRKAEDLRSVLYNLQDRLVNRIDELQVDYEEVADEESETEDAGSDDTDDTSGSPQDLEPGMKVHVSSFAKPGELLEIDEDKGEAHVQVGVMKLRVDVKEITPTEEDDEQTDTRRLKGVSRLKQEHLSDSVTVRQLNSEEALEKVKKHLDDAILAERHKVRIVHGRGEGILRRAIRKYLNKAPYVSHWESASPADGGDGVTIAYLK